MHPLQHGTLMTYITPTWPTGTPPVRAMLTSSHTSNTVQTIFQHDTHLSVSMNLSFCVPIAYSIFYNLSRNLYNTHIHTAAPSTPPSISLRTSVIFMVAPNPPAYTCSSLFYTRTMQFPTAGRECERSPRHPGRKVRESLDWVNPQP